MAMPGFFMLVRLEPRDMALARIGVEAVVRSLRDSVGPDAPTLGMMGVPTLIEDALTRAALADASPSAREALGELERVVVAMGPPPPHRPPSASARRSASPTRGWPATAGRSAPGRPDAAVGRHRP